MPGRRILLVDHDVDALAALAASLRERGMRVSLANGSQMACERAKATPYDVVVAAREVAEADDGNIGVMDALAIELAVVPPVLVLAAGDTEDVDRLVQRIDQLATPGGSPSAPPSSHVLESGTLGDLLLVLGAEKRSGTITMTTATGSGEVRLVDGDVADAVFIRLEGRKAVARMLGERDSVATFAPGAPALMRRMTLPTRSLVDEARALVDRARKLRGEAAALEGTLVTVEGRTENPSALDELVLGRLRVPATLDELLDELPHPDAEILASALALHGAGRIKTLAHESGRVQLCGPEQLHLVRASAARARAAGFRGPTRLVFAATPARLAVLGHTVLSLADAVASPDPAPALPVPYALATLRLGDGVELDVVALPLVPAYAPLWPMALAGAAVIVRLDEGAAEPVEEAAAAVGVAILDAAEVFGEVDESSAVQVATLVRTALEASPG